jgi:ADP-ribose pyrophosphatase YjhB (NUDIX family)
VFGLILAYTVIPTFDLIIKSVDGVLLVKRTISPYNNKWALPGLRIFKHESIDDCLARIARDEVGIDVEAAQARYVGQSVVEFDTRQDLSTCYAFDISSHRVSLNAGHFSDYLFLKDMANLPADTGDLYRNHLSTYFRGGIR